MADRFTTWETNLSTILATELGSSYDVSNKYSLNVVAGEKLYKILIQWTGLDNEIESGSTCFESDRQQFLILCVPLSAVLEDDAMLQCNIMAEAVIDVLRDYDKVNSTTIDSTGTITEMRVSSANKVIKDGMLAVQITFSFLADE